MYQTLFVGALLKCVVGEMGGFIVDGTYTVITNHPHSVFVEFHGKRSFVCGGSILNQLIVLTAAHCTEEYVQSGRKVIIRYGAEKLIDSISIPMASYTVHEQYDEVTVVNDLALLRCKYDIKLGPSAKRVSIQKSFVSPKLAYVSGWGAVNHQLQMSQELKTTAQELQTTQVCQRIRNLPKGTFCAGPLSDSGYPSVGDSGSALMMDEYVQIGIVSFMAPNFPLVVYTNVSHHYNWIKRNAINTYCDV